MEAEKMQINLAPGMEKATIKVIELDKENVLPVLEPLKVGLSGTIGSVAEFLTKRKSEPEQINQKRCHILVDREKMTIILITNETDGRNKAEVKGALAMYPKFIEFGINTEKTWEPAQLSRFIKMNRAFFTDITYNMELVSILKNKGRSAEVIEVEIIADVDGRNIRLSLCSPGAEVVIEQERNKAINEQLKIIRELAPEIAIIEQ